MTRDELLDALHDLVASSGDAELLAEVDASAGAWRRTGEVPHLLGTLFLPTGDLQELAMAAGRGADYLRLADAFDELSRSSPRSAG